MGLINEILEVHPTQEIPIPISVWKRRFVQHFPTSNCTPTTPEKLVKSIPLHPAYSYIDAQNSKSNKLKQFSKHKTNI
jgi:hypothetical protein